MKKIEYTDYLGITYTINEKAFKDDLKGDNPNSFVTATNGTRIAAMFIIEGLFKGTTKVIEENKKHIIFSTDTSQYTYEDYKEWCDECDVEDIYREVAEDSDEFYDWVHEQIDQTIDADRENIKYSEYANRDFIITGTLGLWNGNHGINAIKVNGIQNAIDKCVCNSDIWDYDVFIYDDDDFITVHAKHHDGTNVFELHLLTEQGAEAWEKAYEEYEYGDADFPEIKKEWFEKIDFNKIF